MKPSQRVGNANNALLVKNIRLFFIVNPEIVFLAQSQKRFVLEDQISVQNLIIGEVQFPQITSLNVSTPVLVWATPHHQTTHSVHVRSVFTDKSAQIVRKVIRGQETSTVLLCPKQTANILRLSGIFLGLISAIVLMIKSTLAERHPAQKRAICLLQNLDEPLIADNADCIFQYELA